MIAVFIAVLIFVVGLSSPVAAEPISTAIGLSALLFNAAGGAISVGVASAIGGALITVGGSLALSAASTALQGSNRQSDLNNLAAFTGSGTLSQQMRRPQVAALPEQRLALGTVTTSGALIWRHYDPPYLWHLYALAAHECGDLVSLRINGVDVELENAGNGILRAFGAPFYNISTGVRYIELSYRNGTADQAMDPIAGRDFPTLPATFRQRGTTTVMLKAHFGSSQTDHDDVYGQQNVFNPLFRFRGAKYYDPRVLGCDRSDPSTWVNGSTASLNIARALYHAWPDMKLVDIESFDWDKMAASAVIDDKFRGCADGTVERNHTCDGVILSTADPLQMIKELLTSCDGMLVARGGKYHILSGDRRNPVGTLHQDMLVGDIELHTETPDADLINIVKTEIVAPDRDYKPVVGPRLRRDDLIALDGKPLETTLTLPFTEGHRRGQRLASRKLKESRGTTSGASGRKAFTATFGIGARNVRAGEVWRVAFRDFDKVDGDYMITEARRDESSAVPQFVISGVSWSNEKFDWHAPTDEQEFTLDDDVLTAEAA